MKNGNHSNTLMDFSGAAANLRIQNAFMTDMRIGTLFDLPTPNIVNPYKKVLKRSQVADHIIQCFTLNEYCAAARFPPLQI